MRGHILYFHTGKSTFVDKDVRILEEVATTKTFAFTVTNKKQTPWLLLQQLFFLLRHFFTARLYVCQFAGYHSFLPGIFGKLLKRKTLIISGGTDCHSFPNIGYGNFNKPLLRKFTEWSYQLCSHIAPKHSSLWNCKYTYDSKAPDKQGISAFMPTLKKPLTFIPNGYDAFFWKPILNHERPTGSFITVTGGLNFPFQQALKGIDLILETATHFPECQFTIVGVPRNVHINVRSKNVELLPPATSENLKMLFSNHCYYLQLSMAEGFPNALCEAMLCGCTPIGSSVFSIPEIIGENGYLLHHRDNNELKLLLQKALDGYSISRGENAAKSIQERFSIQRRKDELTALCRQLMA